MREDQQESRADTVGGSSEPQDSVSTPSDGLLRLFVYGTLRRGHPNHDRFCRGFLFVERATVPGTLRWLSPIIPMLEVPEGLILEVGTDDPLADVATQARWAQRLEELGQDYGPGGEAATRGHVGAVVGEVFVFDDPEARLPRLDALEGFRPGGNSLYSRVLLPIRADSTHIIPVWVYVAGYV